MKRLLLPIWLLVVTASVALATLPCKTREEAFAEAVEGFILVQGISAQSCDELLGGTALVALHDRVAAAYGEQVADARTVRSGYFQRAYGEGWEAERERVTALMTDLVSASLAINEENCGQLAGALERRLEGGWEPIRKLLAHRVEGIAATDANLCKP